MLTYQQTIEYLFARLPMFSRIGTAAYKGDLTNTLALCAALDEPQQKFKSIHIAGTNGKGSTSHMLAAILQSAGYKTGLYTSPHLKDFRERIKINGEWIAADYVVQFTERIKPQIEVLEPSFFEITVAMAFTWFAEQQVDIAIIEVGLGGRLDSTNVIVPQLSIITNIGLDHMNILGDTLAKIAFEKAGIIKPRIQVLVGETMPETKPVFVQKAARERAPLLFVQDNLWVADWQQEQHELSVTVADKRTDERRTYRLDQTGLYQTRNLLSVLEAVHQLRLQSWNIPEPAVASALQQVKKLTGLLGRWQVIHTAPYTVLDVAHNTDGIYQIVKQLEHCTYNKLHIVIGMVNDKDISAVLCLLPQTAVYYFTKAQIPRALREEELAAKGAGFGLQGHTYASVTTALQHAVDTAHNDDMILVCGSVFVVGEVDPAQITW